MDKNREKIEIDGHIGRDRVSRIVVSVLVLTVVFITFWFMMDLVLMTFILTFVFYHFQKVLDNAFEKGRERGIVRTPCGRPVSRGTTLAIAYIAGLAVIVLFVWWFATVIIGQVQEIARTFTDFEFAKVKLQLQMDPQVEKVLGTFDISSYIDTAIKEIGTSILGTVNSAGLMLLHFGMSIAISFLFLLERDNIGRFSSKVAESRIGFIYKYFMKFGGNFCHTFGKVMKVQVTIALVNGVLSTIALHFIGMPGVLGLGVMIFALGLIPVAGVIISIIPLAIIAFNTGGITMVIAILVMIVVLHAVEAYVLNPKLMAHRTALPISFVFVILLVAEQYLKFWGLLIGVPLFIFLMTVFQVDYEEVCKQPPSKLAAKLRAVRDGRAGRS
ncbi:MAG: AI-2E family transporter [Clostridiales Family XIII bacterium]|jgi:predicted PurR-regulated permease PerM|nr:AI-2E family transporter [Clostridiales Family XIII bacterium]